MRTPPAPTEDATRVHRLPVASRPTMRAQVRLLLRRHRRTVGAVVAVHGVAVLAGLVGPQVLGRLVEGLSDGAVEGTAWLVVSRTQSLLATPAGSVSTLFLGASPTRFRSGC